MKGSPPSGGQRPKIAVLYHYLYPDDVVSARHFDGLCRGLVDRGWDVEALPSNRGCRDEARTYPLVEEWNGVHIRRVWRPPLSQTHSAGRLLNAAWMMGRWSGIAARLNRSLPDAVIVGTDPLLSVLVALPLKKLRPNLTVAHWAYDLYPEAAIADGMLDGDGPLAAGLKRLLGHAYRSCDIIADLGPCMGELIDMYDPNTRRLTLVPWALAEPEKPATVHADTRRQLFGDAALGLLYSGNFGRAHGHVDFLSLADRLRHEDIHFCFAVRGNRADVLRQAITPEHTNVSLAEFAGEDELERHLGAADIHMASVEPNWTGVVVPSKFFGSLAVGRPVLFSGSRDCAVARWLKELDVGWRLDSDNVDRIAEQLKLLAGSRRELTQLQSRAHQAYQEHFSRDRTMDTWEAELRAACARNGQKRD